MELDKKDLQALAQKIWDALLSDILEIPTERYRKLSEEAAVPLIARILAPYTVPPVAPTPAPDPGYCADPKCPCHTSGQRASTPPPGLGFPPNCCSLCARIAIGAKEL